ncbi:heme A synthase [Histidinibacterium lentulum]|uniref:Heme A synthase n=1 Tax=Histidinibacterium lentulum TaxID=2480588 RepID=A0A3N2R9C4_9RHOB|nr:heme A synthase [Histidinibacterium lentulum]ROU04013.1 heme A synthase [Histidinibacterium lentulum]
MAKKPRAIFEDVATPGRQQAAATGAIERAGGSGARGAVRIWLMVLFALVVVMIAVGGMTRLTDSGLSITEWAPVTGAIPPLNAEDWQREFDLYRQIPEYQLQNAGMTLDEFKVIYWWEWGHRQLGRFIGLVWALGFLWFLLTRTLPRGWTGRLLLLGGLGGLQGAIGWWMVSSGLEPGMLDVASYRLAIHLGLAFVILGLIAWYTFRLARREADLLQARRSAEARLFGGTTGLMHLAFVQILLGALVAGIDAGRMFPTWPDMGGGFLPPEPMVLDPWWRNFFENAGTVQFVHRMAGYLLLVLGVAVWLRGWRSPNGRTRFAMNAVLAVILLQVVIGIVTALYSAPWQLGILHQATAVLLWVLILRARFLARYPLPQSLRGTA